jgi:hypothetical protein
MEPMHPLGLTSSRRKFLKILASAAFVCAGAGLGGCGRYGPAPAGLKFLDDTTYPVVKAFAGRILPPGGAFPEGAGDIDVVEYFDAVVSSQPPEIQSDMRSGILLLQHKALFFRLSLTRFTEMSPEAQDAYLKSWEGSGVSLFRGVFWGFKKICCLGFFSNERIWPYIGFDGPWI